MKKIYYWLICSAFVILSIASCNKSKPLLIYKLSIERNERSVISGMITSSNKMDTIMATDDTLAYQKGLIKYYGGLIAEALVPSAGYESKSFTVTDTSGLDISITLPKKATDSLTSMVKRYTADELKRRKR